MHGTDDEGMMTREIGNVRFLIEQQIQLIDALERQGRDSRAAQDLLRRLMHRDEDLRRPRGGPAVIEAELQLKPLNRLAS